MLRTFLATIALAAPAITVAPLPSHAQSDYPNRMVKIVVPYGAGTVPDIFARALTTGLSGRLGQQFIVENKVGGSGALGTASVVRAEADGYAVLFAPALVLSVLPQSRNDTGYRHDSLVPVCQTFVNTMGLAVRPDQPIKSIGDLVATAKQKPGALNYGHPGVMTIPHLAMEEFMQAAAIDIKDVPFRGGPQTIAELLAGRIDIVSIVIGTEVGQNIRIIGVFGDKRLANLPDVPTFKEQATTSVLKASAGCWRRSQRLSQSCPSSPRHVPKRQRTICMRRPPSVPGSPTTITPTPRRSGSGRARHREQGARVVASQGTIEQFRCLRRRITHRLQPSKCVNSDLAKAAPRSRRRYDRITDYCCVANCR
jgi:tripartite-type tricarboxylate transporter receptor subunit TctC